MYENGQYDAMLKYAAGLSLPHEALIRARALLGTLLSGQHPETGRYAPRSMAQYGKNVADLRGDAMESGQGLAGGLADAATAGISRVGQALGPKVPMMSAREAKAHLKDR